WYFYPQWVQGYPYTPPPVLVIQQTPHRSHRRRNTGISATRRMPIIRMYRPARVPGEWCLHRHLANESRRSDLSWNGADRIVEPDSGVAG
ncbi:MAG: hypothetical protein WBN86_10865, partial [Porticoccaceae bacterium]